MTNDSDRIPFDVLTQTVWDSGWTVDAEALREAIKAADAPWVEQELEALRNDYAGGAILLDQLTERVNDALAAADRAHEALLKAGVKDGARISAERATAFITALD